MLVIMGAGLVSAHAQQVKGTIKDASGQPVIGAAVLVQGTTRGTTTDVDGSFLVNAGPDAVLDISSIGYIGRSILVGGRSEIDIVLEEDAMVLQDVVVVGVEVLDPAGV